VVAQKQYWLSMEIISVSMETLDNVNVAKNQQVSAGTTIGSIGTDFDGNFALIFKFGMEPIQLIH
jgi:hypothetical protein